MCNLLLSYQYVNSQNNIQIFSYINNNSSEKIHINFHLSKHDIYTITYIKHRGHKSIRNMNFF
jgi:Mor family transcriptional regulator